MIFAGGIPLWRDGSVIGGIGVSYTQSADLQGYANISQNYRAIKMAAFEH